MENKIKNSEAYLNSILGKENGFSIPKNYFKNTEALIETRLAEESFTKDSGFNIPDSYFRELENNILSKISFTEKEVKVISFKERILKIIPIAVAATLILFIGLNSFVFNSPEELTLDSLTDDDLEFWLDSNTLTTNEIALTFEDDILDEDEFYFTTIKDESIENYINNAIDYTDLLNEIN